jgi:hypothetical protein
MIGAGPTSAIVSLFVGASIIGACDIDGVTPICSDAGECFTQPGTTDPDRVDAGEAEVTEFGADSGATGVRGNGVAPGARESAAAGSPNF